MRSATSMAGDAMSYLADSRGGNKLLKTLFVVPLFILTIFVGSWAQYYSEADTLSIIQVDGVAGDTISITFSLINSFNVGGFQIRMAYDSTTFDPITMHLASRSANYNLYGADFSTPGVAILYATSWQPVNYADCSRKRSYRQPGFCCS